MKKAINTNYPVKFANRPFTTLYLQPKHQEPFKYAPTEFRYWAESTSECNITKYF